MWMNPVLFLRLASNVIKLRRDKNGSMKNRVGSS